MDAPQKRGADDQSIIPMTPLVADALFSYRGELDFLLSNVRALSTGLVAQ